MLFSWYTQQLWWTQHSTFVSPLVQQNEQKEKIFENGYIYMKEQIQLSEVSFLGMISQIRHFFVCSL